MLIFSFEDLEVGMPLSTFEGTNLIHSGTVTGVEREERVQTMYNLTVNEAHTFFVGEGEWLVHNTNPSNCLTPWGHLGTKNYNEAVDIVRANKNTVDDLKGVIPTRQEAESLINQAGGEVLRVERRHALPNPHNYPHINYTIDGKNVVTIRVEGVGRQYYAPGQKGYGQ